MKESIIAGGVALGCVFMFSVAHTQEMHMHVHDAGEHASVAGGYSPGLGEIMSLQQMRHSKLWFAGNARNWDLAGYEFDELKEGFEDVGKLFPTVNAVSLAPVIDGINGKELADLGKAIEARDLGKFATSFDRLSAACNACHQSTKHPFIVIQRPTTLSYTNQSFAPSRERAAPASAEHHHTDDHHHH
jgi:hypothetical protein